MSNALEDADLDKALKKITTRNLSVLTFKRLDKHIASCEETSRRTLAVLKWVGVAVASLAFEKAAEVFHITTHLPLIGN